MLAIGFFEALIVSAIGIVKLGIPIAAGIWIIFTLRHIRDEQESIKSKLEAIEKSLQRSP